MTLRLTVDQNAFRSHVASVAAATPNLVPVVKGNGYGLGRGRLIELVDELVPSATTIAVGTIHEAAEVPPRYAAHVMTPLGELDVVEIPTNAMLTVGSRHDVDVLARRRWTGRVIVKLASSMRRFGATKDEFPALVQDIARIGGVIHACAIHPPTAGTDDDRLAEIRDWLPVIPDCVTVSVSHLGAGSLESLRVLSDRRTVEARLGTALWHGTKQHFTLRADVMRVEPCRAGETAGYRLSHIHHDGHLVVVGAGTAHGVFPLANGDSPFHFGRQRMSLVEAPYMHSSLAIIPSGSPLPSVGDLVDVQRPLTGVSPDIIEWQ
jgi:alanine racemase